MVALMDLLTATQILEFSGINNDQKPIFLIDQDLCFKSLFMPFKARRKFWRQKYVDFNYLMAASILSFKQEMLHQYFVNTEKQCDE